MSYKVLYKNIDTFYNLNRDKSIKIGIDFKDLTICINGIIF